MGCKDIIGYEELYTIDTGGCVYSKRRGLYLQPEFDKDGYEIYTLSRRCNPKKFKAHRLVALHFIPNPENKPLVNHKDGQKDNNGVDNLEWCTNQENIRHAYDTGLMTTQYNGKLEEDDVRIIRYLIKEGFSNNSISSLFQVDSETVRYIKTDQTWSHVE